MRRESTKGAWQKPKVCPPDFPPHVLDILPKVCYSALMSTDTWVIRNHPSGGYAAVLWAGDDTEVPEPTPDAFSFDDAWTAFQSASAMPDATEPILHEEVQW